MTVSPAVREFETFKRGYVRDIILEFFRSGLLQRTNPETGNLFTADEITRATGEGSRWYREAQAVDDLCQGDQRRALWINDQLRINRACTQWLEEYHARQWDPEGRLAATYGSGQVVVTGTDGTSIVASTTVPDETAYWGRTSQGVRVQVFSAGYSIGTTNGVLTPGQTTVTMIAMDPGSAGNLDDGEIITWAQRDPGMSPQATVSGDWGGGTDIETDAEWASRMEANQRHRPGSGNDAQQRAWARRVSNAVEDAFVYPCAMGDGSFLLCILQKRSGQTGQFARVPSSTLKAAVTAALVSPGSATEPTPPKIMVVEPWKVTVDFGLRIALQAGSLSGWADAVPFPTVSSAVTLPRITTLGSTWATLTCPDLAWFEGHTSSSTVTGSDIPRLMAWDEDQSMWRELQGISSIANSSANTYTINFSTLPSWLENGAVISPYTDLAEDVTTAIRDYMDERGPMELFESDDYRFARCSRFPPPVEEKPYRVGADVASRVLEALSGAAADGDLPYQLNTVQTNNEAIAPQMYLLGKVGIYPLV